MKKLIRSENIPKEEELKEVFIEYSKNKKILSIDLKIAKKLIVGNLFFSF
jgi:hypothetical protein